MIVNALLDDGSTKTYINDDVATELGLEDRSFTCAAPRLWNALPFDIRSARSVSNFKAKLKTHLFRHAFLALIHETHKDPKSGAILCVSQCVSVSVCQCVTLRTRRHVTDL